MMPNSIKIFIPSKGRPDGVSFKKLKESDVPYTVFVDSREVKSYSKCHEDIVDIGKNLYGLGYSRQCILDWSVKNNIKWFWTMDDDINGLFIKSDKTNKLESVSAKFFFKEAQSLILNYVDSGIVNPKQVCMACMAHRHMAWMPDLQPIVPYARNSMQLSLLNADVCQHYSFRYEMLRLKTDTDFQIQCVLAGLNMLKVNKFAFRTKATTGDSGVGGCSDDYKAGKDLSSVSSMVNFWGKDVVSIRKKKDIYMCSVNWRKLYEKVGIYV